MWARLIRSRRVTECQKVILIFYEHIDYVFSTMNTTLWHMCVLLYRSGEHSSICGLQISNWPQINADYNMQDSDQWERLSVHFHSCFVSAIQQPVTERIQMKQPGVRHKQTDASFFFFILKINPKPWICYLPRQWYDYSIKHTVFNCVSSLRKKLILHYFYLFIYYKGDLIIW